MIPVRDYMSAQPELELSASKERTFLESMRVPSLFRGSVKQCRGVHADRLIAIAEEPDGFQRIAGARSGLLVQELDGLRAMLMARAGKPQIQTHTSPQTCHAVRHGPTCSERFDEAGRREGELTY